MKKILFLLLILGVLFFLEPNLEQIFAIPAFLEPQVQKGEVFLQSTTIKDKPEQPSRAPEPSTIMLFLGGIISLMVRFVRKSYEKFKRGTDFLLGMFGFCLFLPILAVCAMLIKLTSRGPIIYKQTRVGEYGKIFKIYKLRTMCVNAEKDCGAVWAKKDDPRVTPIGRILRKTHIDEIPQFLNVIKGEMSIVGPRPERPEMVRDFLRLINGYEKRLVVKPGITGLAQIWHKYDEKLDDVREKIKYDILYIKKICLWVDLKIMAQTIAVILTGKGAR